MCFFVNFSICLSVATLDEANVFDRPSLRVSMAIVDYVSTITLHFHSRVCFVDEPWTFEEGH